MIYVIITCLICVVMIGYISYRLGKSSEKKEQAQEVANDAKKNADIASGQYSDNPVDEL